MPKLNLLYYKNLLDLCFYKFFALHEDCFVKDGDCYVLAKCPSRTKLQQIFTALLKDVLLAYVKPYSLLDANYYFIIGSCMPKSNLLLKFKDGYFPEKLSKAIDGKLQLKYLLKEHDIKIDIVLFNQVFIDIFDKLFRSRDAVCKFLGNKYKNVIFVMNKQLDCYAMFKTIKFLYGRSNCTNIYADKFKDKRSPIVAINDLICKYVHNKVALNKSAEFKKAVAEVKQFIDEKLKEVVA